jgi:hypothetical protein
MSLSVFVFWTVGPSTLKAGDGDSMFLRNFGNYLQVHSTLQLRIPTSIFSPSREPQSLFFMIAVSIFIATLALYHGKY